MKFTKNMKQDIINYLGINPDRRTKDFKYLINNYGGYELVFEVLTEIINEIKPKPEVKSNPVAVKPLSVKPVSVAQVLAEQKPLINNDDMILYKKLHQFYIQKIKNNEENNDLKNTFDRFWMTDDNYIKNLYPTQHAIYRLYDDNSKLIRPDKVAFNGYCKFYINASINNYSSSILNNPTYGEIFLEVDKIINKIFENDDDIDDLSLEAVYDDWGETEYDETYGNIKIIDVDLY